MQADKAPTKIVSEYLNYANGFLINFAIELPEHNVMNDHTIKIIEGKQPLYRPIYSLGLVELETLKIYIKAYLKTGFFQPSKFPRKAFILFNQKSNQSFCLCVNY